MAYTRIHGIKATLNRVIDYIENSKKTEGQLLISGYNVDPYTAAIEYRMTSILGRELKGDYTKTGGANNLAYHMIQSFSPDDPISPEKAHELGKKWADDVLEGKYEYVISTHIDKGHIHNHIVFNSVSFFDYKKFNNYKVAKHLREVSDRICEENGLSIIAEPQKKKSMSHYEWEQVKKGNSWKVQVRESIDTAILKCRNFSEFKDELRKYGIEILEGKYLTFHKIGVESKNGRAAKIRGKTIGEDYTKESILERLSGKKREKNIEGYPVIEGTRIIPGETYVFAKDRGNIGKVTGISGGKLTVLFQNQENGRSTEIIMRPEAIRPLTAETAVKRYDDNIAWHYISNQKRLSELRELERTLQTIRKEKIHGIEDFDSKITELKDKSGEVKRTIKELNERNIQYKNAAKYLLTYQRYQPIFEDLQKQNFISRKKYVNKYSGELEEFRFAVEQLDKMGVNTTVDPAKVMNLVREQDEKVISINEQLNKVNHRIENIRKAREIVKEIMAGQVEERDYEKKKSKEDVER